ncbi:MAG: GreA/GreB family elongation factor, partial [Candidatus Limivicinus sp.]
VGSQEANPREWRISDDSPVGKGLIGHRAVEKLTILVPSGEIHMKIVSVENS